MPNMVPLAESDVRLGRAARVEELARPYVEWLAANPSGRFDLDEEEQKDAAKSRSRILSLVHRAADALGKGVTCSVVNDGMSIAYRLGEPRSKRARQAASKGAE